MDRNQRLTLCVLKWLAQFGLVAYLTQVLLARTDLPTYATFATHESHSLKKMMTESCTHIISAEQYERLLATGHRVTSQQKSKSKQKNKEIKKAVDNQRKRQHGTKKRTACTKSVATLFKEFWPTSSVVVTQTSSATCSWVRLQTCSLRRICVFVFFTEGVKALLTTMMCLVSRTATENGQSCTGTGGVFLGCVDESPRALGIACNVLNN